MTKTAQRARYTLEFKQEGKRSMNPVLPPER